MNIDYTCRGGRDDDVVRQLEYYAFYKQLAVVLIFYLSIISINVSVYLSVLDIIQVLIFTVIFTFHAFFILA